MQSESENEFDKWNTIKKTTELTLRYKRIFPHAGDVWVCILGRNIGREQNGKGSQFLRPVLVIRKINGDIFWILPLSSKQKNLDFYYNTTNRAGRNISIILSQIKVVSVKRFKRKLYTMNSVEFLKIKEKIEQYFKNSL